MSTSLTPININHIHLDSVGGISGDMFCGALLNIWPQLATELGNILKSAQLPEGISFSIVPHRDHTLKGSKFITKCNTKLNKEHSSTYWHEIRSLIKTANLPTNTSKHAIEIFSLLAGAESKVHGIPIDDITFHEVGAWDSIIDIISAAWLIDKFSHCSWTISPLPLGSGQVSTQHGLLPVPTPAVTELLKGFEVFFDNLDGERITPTGAAILAYLKPQPLKDKENIFLHGDGIGFGTNVFPGISNILRVMIFSDEVNNKDVTDERIATLSFEVDDQTPEDLSIALDKIRSTYGVIDVIQTVGFGKKGRVCISVQILTTLSERKSITYLCLDETTTLGVRWQVNHRSILQRQIKHIETTDVRVKTVTRPSGSTTAKAEIDDIKRFSGNDARDAARGYAEKQALKNFTK